MKKYLMISCCLAIFTSLAAQEIAVSQAVIKVSKKAKKEGSYFGGGLDNITGETVAIMSYEDGFDVYKFSENNQAGEPAIELDGKGLYEYLNLETTDTDQKMEIDDFDGAEAILIRSSFTGRNIIMEKGHLQEYNVIKSKVKNLEYPAFSKSRAWNVNKLLFKQDEKTKEKLRIMPIATLVSEGAFDPQALEMMEAASEDMTGATFSGMQSAVKAGLGSAFMKPDGKAVVIGRVVEQVKIGNPVPWNNNRIRTAVVDGATLTATEKDTYVMPFAVNVATSAAVKENEELLMLLVPLNSPNTVKEAKQYQMDKENRNRVMAVFIDKHGALKDSLHFRSAGNDGKYKIAETSSAIFIPALVDANTNSFYNGIVRKPSHFQITKIENGKIAYHNNFDLDDVADMVVVPRGEKFKKLKIKDFTWETEVEMDDGSMVFIGFDNKNHYAFHIGVDGELKKLYIKPRLASDGQVVDSKFTTAGNSLYWISRETPKDVQDASIEIQNESIITSGGYRSYSADVVPRNFKEIKAVVSVAKIDIGNGLMSEALEIGGKKYLIIGDSGFLTDKNGQLRMIGFDMKKKKEMYSVMVK